MVKIDKMDLANKALDLRYKMGENYFSPIDIFALVQRVKNITLIRYPLGEHISGYCRKYEHTNIIAINSAMSIGRQRYTLAHELYHVYYDETMMNSFVCANFDDKVIEEQKADIFASYFLMPQTAIEQFNIRRKGISVHELIELEQYYKMSRRALLYRLLCEGLINGEDEDKYVKEVSQSAKLEGYDDALYKPSPDGEKYYVYGKYIVEAKKLLETGRISEGKYEEYLLAGYRDDIVYGFTDGGEIID